MSNINNSSRLILADSHVHFYDCFDIEQVLHAALKNFKNVVCTVHSRRSFIGVLFLTETRSEDYFHELYTNADSKFNGLDCSIEHQRWIFRRTRESYSLIAQFGADDQLVLLAGRQVVTAENLEVLALVTDQRFEDGQSLEKTVEAIAACGGIPVLPWGLGKWLGRRGYLIDRLIEAEKFPSICLGDNSGRPVFWLRPPFFKKAENKGLRILPGTDPLPLSTEFHRPGSFGFRCQGLLNLDCPGRYLKELLLDLNIPIQSYGNLENPLRFIRNQFAVRLSA